MRLKKYNFEQFKDENLKRQFKKLTKLGYAYLPDDKYKELLDARSSMKSNYATIKICSFKEPSKCDLQLEPEISEIFAKSRDEAELKYYWLEWYNKAGAPVREAFQKYVELNKEAAILNGFSDGAALWLEEYESADFESQIERVLDQLMPLYKQIHGYVRYKLRSFYGDKIVSENGALPMHLLGNTWAQTWDDLIDILAPYPQKSSFDVTDEMVRQGYNPIKMFQMGDEFFASLNMSKVTK